MMIVTDYGEVFNAFRSSSSSIGVGSISGIDVNKLTVLPVPIPIRPTIFFGSDNNNSRDYGFASDDSGHLYIAIRKVCDTFQLLDNVGEKIVQYYMYGSTSYFYLWITTNTKTILYKISNDISSGDNISEEVEKIILTKKLTKIEESKGSELSPAFAVLSNGSLYLDVENGDIKSNRSPDFTGIKDFAITTKYNPSGAGCKRYLYLIKTDNTFEFYKSEGNTAETALSVSNLVKQTDYPITHAIKIDSMNYNQSYEIDNGRVKIAPSANNNILVRDTNKTYAIEKILYNSIGTVEKTYDISIDDILIEQHDCILLNNGTVRFLKTGPSSSEYFDKTSKTLSISFTKITKLVCSSAEIIAYTEDKKIYSFSSSTVNNAFFSKPYKCQEISTFPVHGAGYHSSQLRFTLNQFEACLPEDLRAVISPIPKHTADIVSTVNISDYSHVLSLADETISDKIFTFSDYEIFGKKKPSITNLKTRESYEPPDQPYAYYENGGEGRSTDRKKHNGTIRTGWWTRSCHLYTDNGDVQRVCSSQVQPLGYTSRNSSPVSANQRKSLGIVPCFAIAADIT